jgi:hypothetical protein
MANIPTAQIPNVQTGVGNAPTLSPSAVRTPQIAQMGLLGRGVFDGAGAGMVGLAQGVSEGAQMLSQFSAKMSQANDDFQFAAADRAFSEAVANHEIEASKLPPDRHVDLWQSKYLPKVQETLANMRVSLAGRARIDAFAMRQTGNAYAAIKVGSYRKFLAQGLMESDNYIDRAIEEGRYEDAFAQLARDEESNVRSPQEAEAKRLGIEQQTKWETVTQKVSIDPHSEASKLQKAVDDNEVHPDYPELKTQADRVKALRAARGFERENISRYSGEALERVLQGDFETKEDVRKAYTGLLPEKEIQTLEATLDQTPEAVQQRIELYRPVLALIEAYDPSTDPDLSKRMEVRQAIRQVETGFQRDLVDQLNEKVRQNKPLPPTSVNLIRKDLDGRFKAGEYGAWKTDKDGNPKNDAERQKYEAAMMAYGAEATAFNEWARRNPQATDAEAWGEINRIRTEQYTLNKAAGRDVPRPAALQPPTEQEVKETLRRRGRGGSQTPEEYEDLPPVTSESGRRLPASIRNNNAGAMWPAKWQSKFGGKHGENLKDGKGNKIARFPTPVHGAAATMYLLGNSKLRYSKKTVSDGIAVWSNAKGSDLRAYISTLSKAGFEPDETIADIMAEPDRAIAFTKAMSRFEAGREFPLEDFEWKQAYDMYSRET